MLNVFSRDFFLNSIPRTFLRDISAFIATIRNQSMASNLFLDLKRLYVGRIKIRIAEKDIRRKTSSDLVPGKRKQVTVVKDLSLVIRLLRTFNFGQSLFLRYGQRVFN